MLDEYEHATSIELCVLQAGGGGAKRRQSGGSVRAVLQRRGGQRGMGR